MAELINPFEGYRITDIWRNGHQAIDFGMDMRTPFVSPAEGVITVNWHFEAGNRQTLTLPDRRQIIFCHLDAYAVSKGPVKQHQLLGWAGNTGKSKGPHMHTYGLNPDGSRWNWILDCKKPLPASLPSKDFIKVIAEDDEMGIKLINILGDGIHLAVPGAGFVHVKSTNDVRLIKRLIVADTGGVDDNKRETFNAVERARLNLYLQGKQP